MTAAIHVLPTAEAMARAAAEFVGAVAAEACQTRGRFTVALAGGATPAPLYEKLASPTHARRLAWEGWQVYWSDERCVPPDHAESNYGLARWALLDRVPIPAGHIHRLRGEATPERAAEEYERDVSQVSRDSFPVFDLILLGLGEDGHTASLFPGTAALQEEHRLVMANWVPQLDAHRLTFTLPLINAARVVAFLVDGEAKAAAVRQVLSPAAEAAALPAARVQPGSGSPHWFLTAAAASWLGPEAGKATHRP